MIRAALRLSYGLPPPFAAILAGPRPSVLLYHGVPRRSPVAGKYAFDGEALERQVLYLKRHFRVIHWQDLFRSRSLWDRKAVLLTFDDGLRNNAEVVAPILLRHGLPALFFVSTRHVGSKRVLWFTYLRALEHEYRGDEIRFRGADYDMSPPGRQRSVQLLRRRLLALKPHPSAMYAAIHDELPPLESFVAERDIEDRYAGMTAEQMAALDSHDLFSVECHSVDHPYLTQCAPEEALRQIRENKECIERTCGKVVTRISYPLGDYNRYVVEAARQMGFRTGYAVAPLLRSFSDFEIPRAGIYRAPLEVAGFKAMWSRRRPHAG
jgi:peptidoglycan/xylan/chitin deacetylase (PgdA/CDA1 family)